MTKTSIQWAVLGFKLFAGTGAGLLAFVGLVELFGSRSHASRKALLISIILFALGGVSVLFQLGRPEGVMRVFSNISIESPFSWELLSYVAVVALGLIYFLFAKSSKIVVKIIAVLALILAVAFGFSTGYSHVSMPGTPSWHTPAMPACFLLGALALGGFCYLTICTQQEDSKGFGLVTKILVVLTALLTVSYVVYGFTASLGDHTLVYWALVPLVGGAVSAISAILLMLKKTLLWLYVGLASTLIGAVAMRALVWVIVETGLSSGNIIHI